MQMTDSVEKWQQGDEDAFEALFHHYHHMVRRTAVGILNDTDHAEDVVQDVFVGAWKSRHSFDPQKGKLSTWLYRITVNRCTRYRKKNGKEAASLDDARSRGL